MKMVMEWKILNWRSCVRLQTKMPTTSMCDGGFLLYCCVLATYKIMDEIKHVTTADMCAPRLFSLCVLCLSQWKRIENVVTNNHRASNGNFVMRFNMILMWIVKHSQMKVLQNLLIIFKYMALLFRFLFVFSLLLLCMNLFVGFESVQNSSISSSTTTTSSHTLVQYGIH